MKIFKLIVFLSFLIKIFLCEIRFVFEMFRHGARGVAKKYLNNESLDIYGELWENCGDLTEVGMRQLYLLGYRNRIRYENFLSPNFNTKEIYVVSTNYNKTISSAYSHLLGLFPPGTGPLLTSNQEIQATPPFQKTDYNSIKSKLNNSALPDKIQVIPVHTFDMNAKQFSLDRIEICPNLSKYFKLNLEQKVLKDFYTKFNDTWGSVIKNALNISDYSFFFNHYNLYNIFSTFVSDYYEGKELNVFRKANVNIIEFKKTAYEFLLLDQFVIKFGDENYQVGTMSMSPTILSIVDWMDTRINLDIKGQGYDGYPSPKLVIYSGHDTDLSAMQIYLKNVFKTSNLYYNDFGSSIFLELYRPDNVEDYSSLKSSDYTVQVILNDINLLEMPYSEFKMKIMSMSYNKDQIKEFCGFETASPSNLNYYLTLIITNIVSLVFGGILVYILQRNKQAEKYRTTYALMNENEFRDIPM